MNRSSLAVAVLLAALAGCSKNDSGGGGTPRSGIVFLHDAAYADFLDGSPYYSGSNVEAFLGTGTDLFGLTGVNGIGKTFKTFSSANTATLRNAMAGKKVVIIPEQTARSWAGDLDFEAITELREFVESGGTIITFSNDDRATALADAVLGTALALRYLDHNTEYYQDGTRTTEAAGTPFANGPTSLRNNDAVIVILKDSIPPEGKIIYEWNGDAQMAVIEKGAGHFVLLGWDGWIDPSVSNVLPQNWLQALDIALTKY